MDKKIYTLRKPQFAYQILSIIGWSNNAKEIYLAGKFLSENESQTKKITIEQNTRDLIIKALKFGIAQNNISAHAETYNLMVDVEFNPDE